MLIKLWKGYAKEDTLIIYMFNKTYTSNMAAQHPFRINDNSARHTATFDIFEMLVLFDIYQMQ